MPVTKAWVIFFLSMLALIAVSCNAPDASAQPACAHRGAEHAAQHHQTRDEDSHWHERHGDLPTCNLDKKDDVDDRDHERDDSRWFSHYKDDKTKSDDHEDDGDGTPLYRDHEGYHCYHFHCG